MVEKVGTWGDEELGRRSALEALLPLDVSASCANSTGGGDGETVPEAARVLVERVGKLGIGKEDLGSAL